MSQQTSKTTVDNVVWSSFGRYKVGMNVSHNGSIWANSTGKNSEPGVGSDWVGVEKALEGYKETGTRAGGDLVVTIGDYDDSDNGAVLELDVPNETVSIKSDNQLNKVELSPNVISFRVDDGSNGVFLRPSNTSSTTIHNLYLPDSDGTLATEEYVGVVADGLRTDVDTNASDLEGVKTKTDDTISYKYIPSSFDFLNIPLGYDNSIWEIRYDFDLETNSVTIPENVTLYFKGGSFSNGELIGDKTKIDANLDYIFKEDLDLSGDFSVENVKSSWFGVKDVSNFDNSENLQKAIFVKENVRINKGTYYINETIQSIESKANQGISIFGNNNSVTDPVYASTARNETSTSLLWNGLDGGTMFNFKNTINLLLENIVLHGNNKAGVLAHFTTDNTLANAVNSFKNCSLYNADVLVKFGELSTDGTCSDFYFLKSQFTNATYGVQVVNNQGLNYNLNQISANNIESVLRMDRGGHLNMNMCNFVNTGSDANGNYSIHIENSDDNAFSNFISGIRFEQNSENFLYARGHGDTKIVGLTESQASSTTNKIKLRGHSLVIEDSKIASWDNLVDLDFLSGINPYITFRNTYFSSIKTFEDIKDMFTINTNSPAYISIENCTIKNSSGVAKRVLSNFYSSTLLGEVVHYVTITGTGVLNNAYLFGETSQNRYNTIELPKGVSSIKTEIVGEDLGNGDFLGATLSARVYWDGTTATILSSNITDVFTTGTSTFNTAFYQSSIIGCRVRITNSTGTIKYTCKTKIL